MEKSKTFLFIKLILGALNVGLTIATLSRTVNEIEEFKKSSK